MKTSPLILCGAAVLSLLAGRVALAGDIPGGPGTKAVLPIKVLPTIGNWEVVGDSDWYRVTLKKGQNYAFRLDEVGDASVYNFALRDAKGKALKQDVGDLDYNAGFEFVPARSGTYFLDAKLRGFDGGANGAYEIAAGPDCATSPKTTCDLKVGATPQQRQILFYGDKDWYRLALQAGKGYTFTLVNTEDYLNEVRLDVVDAGGKVLATSAYVGDRTYKIAGFKPKTSGTFYLQAQDSSGEGFGPYTVGAE